jgi:hypothetical protein
LGAEAGLDAGGLEELANEFTAFDAVIVQGFVGPLSGDQHPAPGNAQVFQLVSFAFALPGSHGVSGAFGLDAIQQPHRTPGEHGIGSVVIEPGSLAYRLVKYLVILWNQICQVVESRFVTLWVEAYSERRC